jgi:DHA1 family multidrug resistance protein-like MFS transporter
MADTLRDAPLGQLLRWVTNNRLLPYPEELPDFKLPATYNALLNSSDITPNAVRTNSNEKVRPAQPSRQPSNSDGSSETKTATPGPACGASHVEKVATQAEEPNPRHGDIEALDLSRTKSRAETCPWSEERFEVEELLAIERTKTKPIIPTKTSDGIILVDFYTTDDPANPQNWSNNKRAAVSLIICIYTFVVYAGSAIYTSSELGVIAKFGVSKEDASLPLSLYVLAYGLGPLLFAPLSEIPVIGRSPVYAASMAIFVIISIPTPLVNNFAGLLVLRFLQGFFGSPCLAIGGATMQDMYSLLYLPYALVAWVSAAYCGPALGPLLSGFAVMAKGWRWSLWEILWAAGPTFLVMFMLLPETSTPNILLRRAQRLRKLTGNKRLMSQSEIDQKHIKPSKILVDSIIKPMEITIKDPAIAFVNIYTAIIYG